MIAISRFVEGRLLRDGYLPHRIRYLPNPAPDRGDLEVTPLGSDADFLYLGRLVPEKGVSFLLAGFACSGSAHHLHIAGSGPNEADLRQAVERQGLSGRVTFHGWLEQRDVASLIEASRAVIVPSLWHEPFGLAALEAAAHGRPAIVSQVGGLPEVVQDGITGIIVPPDDLAALAFALDRLSDDLPLAKSLGEAGHERAITLFSLDQHVARLQGIYEEVALT